MNEPELGELHLHSTPFGGLPVSEVWLNANNGGTTVYLSRVGKTVLLSMGEKTARAVCLEVLLKPSLTGEQKCPRPSCFPESHVRHAASNIRRIGRYIPTVPVPSAFRSRTERTYAEKEKMEKV